MKALVVYESMFGDTRDVANEIAAGLSSAFEVDVAEVGTAPEEIGEDIKLLVVGGPTHAFGMSRASSRRDAEKQATGAVVSSTIGLREWFDNLRRTADVQAVAFCTRVSKPRIIGLTTTAGRGIEKRLAGLGFDIVAKRQSFSVESTTGPLTPGESERARHWGEELAAMVKESAHSA